MKFFFSLSRKGGRYDDRHHISPDRGGLQILLLLFQCICPDADMFGFIPIDMNSTSHPNSGIWNNSKYINICLKY